jgi:methylmalonyl-CoA/ethylmalonyl-CoA epimerase
VSTYGEGIVPAFFDLAGTRLMLESNRASQPGDTDATASVLYLRTDHIDADYDRLRAAGVAFAGPPHLIHRDDDGTFGAPGTEDWMAFFTDPAGNTLALATRR